MWVEIKVKVVPYDDSWGFDAVHSAFSGIMHDLVHEIGTDEERRGWDGSEARYRENGGEYNITVRLETDLADPAPAIYEAMAFFLAWVQENVPADEVDEYTLAMAHEQVTVSLDSEPRRAEPVMVGRRRLLIPGESFIWHITTAQSAESIFENGFDPDASKHQGGPGVSFSTNIEAARGLLRAVQHMNSLESFEEVEQWALDRGMPEDKVLKIREDYDGSSGLVDRRLGRQTPAGYLLRTMCFMHPGIGNVGGTVHPTEFLWADLAAKLAYEDVVTITAALVPDAEPVTVPFTHGVESEWFVRDREVVRQIVPVYIDEHPEDIEGYSVWG